MNMAENDACELCNDGDGEDIEHMLFYCPKYHDIRIKYEMLLNSHITIDGYDLAFAELLPSEKVKFLIGDIGYHFNDKVGLFYDQQGMSFLQDCFDLRNESLK